MAPTTTTGTHPGTTDPGTAPEQRTPLSARRLRQLEYHGLAAGTVAVGAVAAAWLAVVSWHAGLFAWPIAAEGFRHWLVTGGITVLFWLLLCTVGGNVFASVRNTTGGLLTAHQPLGGLVTVTTVVLSVPRWPDLAAAWTHNTAAPLAAHWPLWLASIAPAILAGLVGHAATEYTEWTGFRLECAQRDEAEQQTAKPALWAVMPGPRGTQSPETEA